METLKNNSQKILIAILIALAVGVIILMFLLLSNKEELKSTPNGNIDNTNGNSDATNFEYQTINFPEYDGTDNTYSESVIVNGKEIEFTLKDNNKTRQLFMNDKFLIDEEFYLMNYRLGTIDILGDIVIVASNLDNPEIDIFDLNGNNIKKLDVLDSSISGMKIADNGYYIKDKKIITYGKTTNGFGMIDCESVEEDRKNGLTDDSIASMTYEIEYLGNYRFSDIIAQEETKQTYSEYLDTYNLRSRCENVE